MENREIPAFGVADDALLGQNRDAVRSDDVSRELAALQEEIAALQAAAQEEGSAMAALEAQLTEQRDRLTLARRLLADQEKQIEQKRAELEEAMADRAIATLSSSVRAPSSSPGRMCVWRSITSGSSRERAFTCRQGERH